MLIAKVDFSQFSQLQNGRDYSLDVMYQAFVDGVTIQQENDNLSNMAFIFDDEALSVYTVFSDYI